MKLINKYFYSIVFLIISFIALSADVIFDLRIFTYLSGMFMGLTFYNFAESNLHNNEVS